MKNNTNISKEFLNKALSKLPNDFALREVRYHIKQALTKIEGVENKREKRETQSSHWYQLLNNNVQNPLTPYGTLDVINKMIDVEKDKLEAMKSKPEDEGDVQTLFN